MSLYEYDPTGRRLQQGMLHIGLISESTRRPSALWTHTTHYQGVGLCGLVALRLISKESLAVAEEVAHIWKALKVDFGTLYCMLEDLVLHVEGPCIAC